MQKTPASQTELKKALSDFQNSLASYKKAMTTLKKSLALSQEESHTSTLRASIKKSK